MQIVLAMLSKKELLKLIVILLIIHIIFFWMDKEMVKTWELKQSQMILKEACKSFKLFQNQGKLWLLNKRSKVREHVTKYKKLESS